MPLRECPPSGALRPDRGQRCNQSITPRPARKPLAKQAPTLQSLAAAILAEFGIGGFPGDVESLKAVGYIGSNPQ